MWGEDPEIAIPLAERTYDGRTGYISAGGIFCDEFGLRNNATQMQVVISTLLLSETGAITGSITNSISSPPVDMNPRFWTTVCGLFYSFGPNEVVSVA